MMPRDEFLTQFSRMCLSYRQCVGCPLYVAPDVEDPNALPCAYHEELHTEAADQAVTDWVAEHPGEA